MPFKDRPLVYVAGPYTSSDPVRNTHNTIRLAQELADEGLVTPVVPHLTMLWHAVVPQEIDFWYAYDVMAQHYKHATEKGVKPVSGCRSTSAKTPPSRPKAKRFASWHHANN